MNDNVSILMTDPAIKKVKELMELDDNPNLKLRVYIIGGGCSGFEYGFAFEEEVNDDDTKIEYYSNESKDSKNDKDNSPVNLIVDPLSLNYLKGASVDYTEGLQGSRFVVNNPNASTTCGCGCSFSV